MFICINITDHENKSESAAIHYSSPLTQYSLSLYVLVLIKIVTTLHTQTKQRKKNNNDRPNRSSIHIIVIQLFPGANQKSSDGNSRN